MIQWLFESFVNWAAGWVRWLLDPTAWVDAALEILGGFMRLVGESIGGEVGTTLYGLGERLGDAEIVELFRFGLWMTHPVITPSVLLACIAVSMQVWAVSMVLKIIMNIKSHIWSAPA